jgi:putative ABC transport system permease protein
MSLSPLDLALTTCKDLTGNLVRSGLTALGIFMGVAAVNATLNIDAITNAKIQERLAQLDNPYVSVNVVKRNPWRRQNLTTTDLRLLQQRVPGIRDVSSVAWVYGFENLTYQDKIADQVSVWGVSANYQRTTGRKLLQGRFFDQSDYDNYRAVAVIDSILAEMLFPEQNPINEGVYGRGTRFTVIGVIETKKSWEEEEPTGEMWIPQTYASVLTGRLNDFGSVQLALRGLKDTGSVLEEAKAVLEEQYPTYDVWAWSNTEEIAKEKEQQEASARILKVVGLMALVIGGVGIANITMAAVMERTREIGLRRAIGATDLEVMAQFIVEAAVLSLVGGAAAVVTVHFLTQMATTRLYEAPYEFNPRDAALSMVAAFAVGVGSSFLPALRVTRIDVVQALRGE